MTDVIDKENYIQIPLQKCSGSVEVIRKVKELLNKKTKNFDAIEVGGILTIKYNKKA